MARCRRCGTIYGDGARYCPKCGEPERAERGLFRAPMPDSSSGGESGGGRTETARRHLLRASALRRARRRDFDEPRRAAVDFQDLSARLRSARPRRFFALARRDMGDELRAVTVRHVRGLRRARLVDAPPQGKPPSALRGGRDFHAHADSLVSTLTNSLKYISLPGAF